MPEYRYEGSFVLPESVTFCSYFQQIRLVAQNLNIVRSLLVASSRGSGVYYGHKDGMEMPIKSRRYVLYVLFQWQLRSFCTPEEA